MAGVVSPSNDAGRTDGRTDCIYYIYYIYLGE